MRNFVLDKIGARALNRNGELPTRDRKLLFMEMSRERGGRKIVYKAERENGNAFIQHNHTSTLDLVIRTACAIIVPLGPPSCPPAPASFREKLRTKTIHGAFP